MVQIRLIDDADAAAWDLYVSCHPDRTFYHEYAWRDVFRDYFKKHTYYMMAISENRVCGILPLVRQKSRIFGDYIVSLPFLNYGGPLVDNVDVAKQMLTKIEQLVDQIGTGHVELRGLERVGELPCKTKKVSMRLALPGSSEELHRSFSSKLRSQIRRPIREGTQVLCGGTELLDRFYAVFSRNMRDLGTPVYSKQFFREILQRFPDQSDIVAIELDGHPISAGFLLHRNGMSEIPWASSDRRFNKISVNMLLYWEVLKRSIERESRTFDFGRSSLDSGTYRFKKQWGAEPRQLFWSYVLPDGTQTPELNPENKKYAMAIRAWQKLPIALANFFGPLLARNLP